MISKRIFSKLFSLTAIAAACATAVLNAKADVQFAGSSGSLAASVSFDVIAGNLQMTLNNTSLADVTSPTGGGGILTSVFFDLSPATVMTPVSAVLGVGSTVYFGADGGGNVGGEWAYKSGLVGAPSNARLGISSTGLGIFGAANFNGSNLQGPAVVDGLQYGITSAGDNLATGNAAVTGGFALIKSSVVFTLSGNPGFTTISDYTISNVTFQYGTDLSEPRVQGYLVNTNVPEPTVTAICTVLLVPIVNRLRQKNSSTR